MADPLGQALRDWNAAGVSGLGVATAAEWPPALAEEPRSAATDPPEPSGHSDAAVAEAEDDPPAAGQVAGQAKLDLLAARVSTCVRCPELAACRTQTVFGEGSATAKVMFIGEAPGADEDAAGRPFVGKAGQLLDKIIAASGWRREELYICNILRCRPPGNRNPLPQEAENCREYLDGQIDAVRPDWIVCWGSVAAQNLLGTTSSIGKMRQRLFSHAGAKVLCTYHPSYLLRNPAAKKDVWSDLKFLFEAMGHTPPSAR